MISGLLRHIPYSEKQGIFLMKQGIIFAEQGISNAATIPANFRFRGQSGHHADNAQCRLLTRRRHESFCFAALR